MKSKEIIVGKIAIENHDFGGVYDSQFTNIHSIIEEHKKEDGWRLPTIEESRYIRILYDLGIGNFENVGTLYYLMKKTEMQDGYWINSYNLKTKYLTLCILFYKILL